MSKRDLSVGRPSGLGAAYRETKAFSVIGGDDDEPVAVSAPVSPAPPAEPPQEPKVAEAPPPAEEVELSPPEEQVAASEPPERPPEEKPPKRTRAPRKQKTEASTPDPQPPQRTTGTYVKPYRKQDGTTMAKWGFHAPTEFIEKYRRFAANLPLGKSGPEWTMEVIRQEIEKWEKEQRK